MSTPVTDQVVSDVASTSSIPSGSGSVCRRLLALFCLRLLFSTGGVPGYLVFPLFSLALSPLRAFAVVPPCATRLPSAAGDPSRAFPPPSDFGAGSSMSVPREDPSRALGALPSSNAAAAPRGEAISHQLALPLLPRITLPPFQNSRSAGDSPPSIEFVPASAPPAFHVVDSAVARGLSSAGEEENAGKRWFGSPLERSAPCPLSVFAFRGAGSPAREWR